MRFLLILFCVCLLASSPANAWLMTHVGDPPPKVTQCFWLHGKLEAANGAPPVRLWHIGTHHMFDIESCPPWDDPEQAAENPDLPSNIKVSLVGDIESVGDFKICPLERFVQGSMQSACIIKARNIHVISDP